jgi:hypothetical protein
MNSTTNFSNNFDLQRQRFEQLIQQEATSTTRQKSAFSQALINFGSRVVNFLTGEPEIRIWQKTRNGHSVWFAYDPITDKKQRFDSEEAVRQWLECRYYES